MTNWYKKTLIFSLLCIWVSVVQGQRTYQAHSVLASGNWFKIEIDKEGLYKMDVSFLTTLGLQSNIPAAQIRLFGKKAVMLPEANGAAYTDDLEEVALQVNDGGDGILNGSDYILFYSTGLHTWLPDAINKRFTHQKNLYSEKLFYYIAVGGTGKRVQTQSGSIAPATTVTSFDERYFHESDSVNFLSSGKEWFGEELSALPGRSVTRQFAIPGEAAIAGSPVVLVADAAARSVNANSSFNIAVNNQPFQTIPIAAVGSTPFDLFAQQSQQTSTGVLAGAPTAVNFTYVPSGFNAQGWINWFEIFYRRQLSLSANAPLLFRDWSSVGVSAASFIISNADATTQVWDVTDPFAPVRMNSVVTGTTLSFTNDAQQLHEYAAFKSITQVPKAVGKVNNQDLHNTAEVDYLIVAHPLFLSQAQRLAQFHKELKTRIVTTEEIYNEFSAGIPTPTAIRDFVKMYYDKYKATWSNSPKYLLLFGRGSFDYKTRLTNNTNFVPAYESVSTLDPMATYTSDDFFGFLDDHEDINSTVVLNQLDIGIGRIPVRNIEEAKNFVDKVIAYHMPSSFGPWRNNLSLVADDEDQNLHVQDAEILSSTTTTVAPVFNIYKYYLDAFKQEVTAAGGRYPLANQAIDNAIYNGTLIWNYSGHGGWQRLAEEVVLDQKIVNSWNNENKLPLFITATCDFAPFDQPNIFSLGENLLVRPKTGAIALMTTTRVVFANSNRIMNDNYLRFALQADNAGRHKTLGEAVQTAKNYTYLNSSDLVNNRKFTLIGDPAMRLGFPEFQVVATHINDIAVSTTGDTLRATQLVTLKGEVQTKAGSRLNDFNGTVYLSLFDKPQTASTLGNDPSSQPATFATQTAPLFKGKVTVTNGQFEVKFRLPKDINYQFGPGKLSWYANDEKQDAAGFSSSVIIGGLATGVITDKEGPVIKAYLNDERFVNGSISNEQPVLLLHLSDSSGINTGGSSIGHDIVATLDGSNTEYYVLNAFYESKLDSYQEGTLRFQLPALAPGPHTLKIKAWDVVNNSGETTLDFTVVNNEELTLDHVLNYPNPFSTKTAFWFEHNKPGIDLQTTVEIYTVAGKLIKTLRHTINNEGNRSIEIEWDGRDDYGDRIGRGVYIYRLTVRSADGKKAHKLQRLFVIQ